MRINADRSFFISLLVSPGTTSNCLHAGSTVPDTHSLPLHFGLEQKEKKIPLHQLKKPNNKLQARTSASHHSTPIRQLKTRKGQGNLLLKFCRTGKALLKYLLFRYTLGHF